MGLIIVLFTYSSSAQNNSNSKQLADSIANYQKMRDSLVNVYTKEYEKKKQEYSDNENQKGFGNNLFGLNLDIILGVGFVKTEFESANDTTGLSNAESKKGPILGVNVNFNLLGFSLGTGFTYSSKGYVANSKSYNANYFNIPLMFSFNFNIKKVEIDLSAGPYIGILLSQDNNPFFEMKNIDLGITGTAQGSYFFNRFIGALVGVKYERGGLNDLLKSNGLNNYVSGIKTQNWFVYSGIKIVL